MLICETNTPEVEQTVRMAFMASDISTVVMAGGDFEVFFEHGQWWCRDESGATWSVVDVEGPSAIEGLGFEQIDNGDEDVIAEFARLDD